MNRDEFNPIFDMLELDRVGPVSRNFYNRRNFDDATDWEQRYRLQASSISYILERIGPHLEIENRLGSLSAKQQLLTTLHFYSSNAFYHVMRDCHGPSESTVCRAIRRVTNALNTAMFDDVIGWPSSCDNLAEKFFNIGGMPSVCGAVDGILIPIIAPSVDEHQYVDRHKIGHSINVMAVAGPTLEFFYISARWPGSVNDARVLRRSSLNDAFSSGYRPFPDAVLLGDSIYPTKRWLIPPIQSPQTNAEAAFNAAQKRTRAVVERAFGIWKNRFPVLGKIRVKTPAYACEIIKATAVLHNMCLRLEPERYRNNTAPIAEQVVEETGDHIVIDDNSRRSALVKFFN